MGTRDRETAEEGRADETQAPPEGAEANGLLAVLFEASATGLAVVGGPELRFERVNAAFRALLPDPSIDPTGQRFEEVWQGNEPDLAAVVRRTLESGEPFHSDELTSASGARARRFSLDVSRAEWRGRAVVLVALWETTALSDARQQAEEIAKDALRHAAGLEALVDAFPDAFVLYGPRGEVVRMNASAARLLALSPEERDLPFAARWGRYRAWTAGGRPLAYEETPVARALAGEVVRAVPLRVEARGLTSWLVASAAPIRAPGGAVWGAVGTFSDISAAHALEEAREDLVRMISHDLRTPLTAVLAQAHLLRRHPEDAGKVEERARSIARSCERMSAMIQDLLEGTLLEAGELRVSPRNVDLGPFVAEAIERQRGALAVERVAVVAPQPTPAVEADPDRLERIVLNLVSNALKYSPAQSPVQVEVASAPGGATIAVTDRGVGIAPEDLPHLFERFFRSRAARRPEGIGLGLYITRLLVYAHGGWIEVDSQLGRGTSFKVFLPERASASGPRAP
jgi:two-component system, OmpR family, phosphate regulon sensor histidine kinase PhoR